MPDQVQALLSAGFDDYWIKPMGLEDFLRRLDEALRQPAKAAHA
jgi:DNA-binding response OmpR family regulator